MQRMAVVQAGMVAIRPALLGSRGGFGAAFLRHGPRRCIGAAAAAPLPPPSPPPPSTPTPPQPASEGASRPLHSYNQTLQSMANRPQAGQAVESLLDEMYRAGVQPTVQSYNHGCTAWAREGNVEAVQAMIATMKQRSVEPNVVSYTNLIKAFAVRGDVDGALKAMDTMREQGFAPNSITYNVVIHVLGKQGRFQEAERLLDKLESGEKADSSDCSPAPYCCLMNFYMKADNVEAADRVWQRMNSLQVVPDTVGFTSYIQLCLRHKGLAAAQQAFEQMLAKGAPPNGTTFAVFLNVHAKDGNVAAAQELWKRMESMYVRPTVACYNAMIQVYAKADMTELAEHWMEKLMDPRRKHFFPNAHSFGTMMDVYAKQGRPDKCLEILDKLRESQAEENRVHHNTVIKAYVNAGNQEAADEYFKKYDQLGFQPDEYTYISLITGFLRQGNLARADELHAEMRGRGLEADSRLARSIEAQRERMLESTFEARPEEVEEGQRQPEVRQQQQQQATASSPVGVDWIEELRPDGSRLFRHTRDGRQTAAPDSGIVQLTSEHGVYYWDVASNQTFWELPQPGNQP